MLNPKITINSKITWLSEALRKIIVPFKDLVYIHFFFILTTSRNYLKDSIFSARKVTKRNAKQACFHKQNKTLLCFIHAKWKPLFFAALQIEYALVNCVTATTKKQNKVKKKGKKTKAPFSGEWKLSGPMWSNRTSHWQTYFLICCLQKWSSSRAPATTWACWGPDSGCGALDEFLNYTSLLTLNKNKKWFKEHG